MDTFPIRILFHHGVGDLPAVETHLGCPMSVCAVTKWPTAAVQTCESLSSLRVVPGGAR